MSTPPVRGDGQPAGADLLASLRVATAAASAASPAREQRTVAWDFPAPPQDIVDAVRTAYGLRVVEDRSAADPRSLPAFATLAAHARSEQVIRALAHRTNLALPAAEALVIGDGTLATTIARALRHGGTRVRRGVLDPVAALRSYLDGEQRAVTPWTGADLIVVTGEGHHPVDPSTLSGVVIDASVSGTGTGDVGTRGEVVRPFVRRLGPGSWIVDAPDVHASTSGPSRITDALVALSVLVGPVTDAEARRDADLRLAELVLS